MPIMCIVLHINLDLGLSRYLVRGMVRTRLLVPHRVLPSREDGGFSRVAVWPLSIVSHGVFSSGHFEVFGIGSVRAGVQAPLLVPPSIFCSRWNRLSGNDLVRVWPQLLFSFDDDTLHPTFWYDHWYECECSYRVPSSRLLPSFIAFSCVLFSS